MNEFSGHSDQHFGHVTYSQHGEDIMLLNLFKLLEIGQPHYLDLGAHHPIHISNTKLLYDRLGSWGVNVEANPHLISAFEKQRPHDVTLNYGVTPSAGISPFFLFDRTSGRNTMSKDEADKFSAESGRPIDHVMHVPCKSLNQIVNEYCKGKFPEFLNCDVEGLDYEILATADFDDSRPVIICVETRLADTEKMTKMMMGKKFQAFCRMGENMLYVDAQYSNLLAYTIGLY